MIRPTGWWHGETHWSLSRTLSRTWPLGWMPSSGDEHYNHCSTDAAGTPHSLPLPWGDTACHSPAASRENSYLPYSNRGSLRCAQRGSHNPPSSPSLSFGVLSCHRMQILRKLGRVYAFACEHEEAWVVCVARTDTALKKKSQLSCKARMRTASGVLTDYNNLKIFS